MSFKDKNKKVAAQVAQTAETLLQEKIWFVSSYTQHSGVVAI